MAESNGFKRQLWTASASIIVTLLIQTASALYWAGSINARVANMESTLARCEERVHALEVGRYPQAKES